MTLIQTNQNAQQENKGTGTSQERKQEQHLPTRHAGRPVDCVICLCVCVYARLILTRSCSKQVGFMFFARSLFALLYLQQPMLAGRTVKGCGCFSVANVRFRPFGYFKNKTLLQSSSNMNNYFFARAGVRILLHHTI